MPVRHETRVLSTHGAQLLANLLKWTVEDKVPPSGTEPAAALRLRPLCRSKRRRMPFQCTPRRLVCVISKPLSEQLRRHNPESRLRANTALAFDARMLDHKPPRGTHPECPQRLLHIWNALIDSGLGNRCTMLPSRRATREEITAVHTQRHFEEVLALEKAPGQLDGDTYCNTATTDCALLAAGLVTDCTLAVARGSHRNAFAVVRPPGHHAYADASGGFCIFNNVAIAAKAALAEPNIDKVLIVDWDVHHGNGTESIFYDSKQVLFWSVHGHAGDFYPGTGEALRCGEGEGEGFNVNIPWDGFGLGDQEYLALFRELLLPIASQFKPDLVIVSAGFDAAQGDPLGNMCVTPGGYAAMLSLLLPLANGKVVLALEGGYNLPVIAACSRACLAVLLGETAPAPSEVWRAKEEAERVIAHSKQIQSYFWTLA